MDSTKYRILYIKRKILFPSCSINLLLQRSNNTNGLKSGDHLVACPVNSILNVMFSKNRMAILAEIQEIYSDEKEVRIQLKGLNRVRLIKIKRFQEAEVEIIQADNSYKNDALSEKLRKRSQELIFLINVEESDRLISLLNFLMDLNQLTDFIANYFILDYKRRSKLFRELDIKKRALNLVALLTSLIMEMKNKRMRKEDEKISQE